jgi:hypothetical protein
MEGDVSGDESGSPAPRQDMVAHRDGYVAGHDLHVHVHESPPQIPPAPTPAAGIWGGVPARNPAFTGRAELLGALRGALASAGPVAVQALRGMGGVGKTQIAIEYAHRFSAEYEVVWWLNAENATLLGEQFASLAVELGCSDPTAPLDAVRPAVLGVDHLDTLVSANNLAASLYRLGEYGAARELDADTLERYRRMLGEDHPATQRSARNLAADLRALG